METGQIKINGDAITVIFTGEKYYFHSNYWGIVGIATRVSDLSELHNKKFSLIAGTKGTSRSKYIYGMKRYIRKAEQKYVACNVDFDDTNEYCNHYLDIECKMN